VPLAVLETGGAAATAPPNGNINFKQQPELVRPARNTLFTSGTMGRFSNTLNAVMESPGELYHDPSNQPVEAVR
jgi:hypothetical protein